MILTGAEIEKEWANGRITITPFSPEQINPNSYNFRLGSTLRVYREERLDPRKENPYDEIVIPDEGYVLEPRRLYLAHTVEVLGSDHYVPTFAARSSVARLGMFIHLSSGLGDIGYKGQWTLQLHALHRVRVYPGINIGQMMWWRPQGRIALYEGKYQGASGPRSSDIHLDFEKQMARSRFPGLGAGVEVDEVGAKFANLAVASAWYRVPTAVAVPATEFADALPEERAAELADAFADLRATVGAFYTESVARIQALGADLRMPDEARRLLVMRLRDVFGDAEEVPFAVRSSGLDEDGAATSQAGLHHSVLNVRGLDNVISAVERCWASYYEVPAVSARVRAGDHAHRPRLAVIVQRMVEPTLAGVAFTGLDPDQPATVAVEYVRGLADELVAGIADAVSVDSTALPGGHEGAVLADVVAMARGLRERRGHDVDVEWAADADGVHLVQVRPLTATNQRSTASDQPVGESASLYFDDLPADFDLGDVAGVYTGYTAKRGPAHRLARECGVRTGAGWVLRFNGRGLADPDTAARLRAALAAGSAEECVLDLSDALRQIVVPKDEAQARLAESVSGGSALHTAIVRDFIRGDLGVISHLSGDGMVVEFTPEGLMALNRGTAGGQTIVVADVRAPLEAPGNLTAGPDAAPLLPHLPAIARLTAAMTETYGQCTLEWVADDGDVCFVDYSVLGGHDVVVSATGGVQISPGTASGPLLRLDEDDLLARLSIGPAVSIDKSVNVLEHQGLAAVIARVAAAPRPPIVHASRPYAVLSVLIGSVAGFVFDQGSALGHLAILLREAGVPAVAAPGFAGQGEAVISGGAIVLAGSALEDV